MQFCSVCFPATATGMVGVQNKASCWLTLDVHSEQVADMCWPSETGVFFVTASPSLLWAIQAGARRRSAHMLDVSPDIWSSVEKSGSEFEICAAWVQVWRAALL